MNEEGPCSHFAQALLRQPEDPRLVQFMTVCTFSYLDKSFGECMKTKGSDSPTDFLSDFARYLEKLQNNSPVHDEDFKVLQATRQCLSPKLAQEYAQRVDRLRDPNVLKSVLSSWDHMAQESTCSISPDTDSQDQVQQKFNKAMNGPCAEYAPVRSSDGSPAELHIQNMVNGVYRYEMFNGCVNATLCADAIKKCMSRDPQKTAIDCMYSEDVEMAKCVKRLNENISL